MASAPEQWFPAPLLRQLTNLGEQQFEDKLAGCPSLLVRLDEIDGVFHMMLAASTRPRTISSEFSAVEPMEFRTAMAELPAAARSTPPPAIEDDIHREMVQVSRLLHEPRFLVLMGRTVGSDGMLGRLTVGRNRNHDIVLRDGSVSKLHAAIRIERDGHMTLRDMDSKNGTFINGEAINSDWWDAYPGDTISFGTIQAQVCSPPVLYRVLHGID